MIKDKLGKVMMGIIIFLVALTLFVVYPFKVFSFIYEGERFTLSRGTQLESDVTINRLDIERLEKLINTNRIKHGWTDE